MGRLLNMPNNKVVNLEENRSTLEAAVIDSAYSVSGAVAICTFMVAIFGIIVLFYGEPDIHSSIICALRGNCAP